MFLTNPVLFASNPDRILVPVALSSTVAALAVLELDTTTPEWRTAAIEDPPLAGARCVHCARSSSLYFVDSELCAIRPRRIAASMPLVAPGRYLHGPPTPRAPPYGPVHWYAEESHALVFEGDVLALGCEPHWRPVVKQGIQNFLPYLRAIPTRSGAVIDSEYFLTLPWTALRPG